MGHRLVFHADLVEHFNLAAAAENYFLFLFDLHPSSFKFPLQPIPAATITMNTLRKRSWIQHIDDERGLGHGIIITLHEGFVFELDPSCSVMGFDTIKEAIEGTGRDCIVPAAA